MANSWLGKWEGSWLGRWLGSHGSAVSSIPQARVHLYFAVTREIELPSAVSSIAMDFTASIRLDTPAVRALALTFIPVTKVACNE